MSSSPIEEARHYYQRAYTYQMSGKLDEAIALYRRSIQIYPTAEAHTFLGWTYSFKGDLEGAIEECKQAIAIDPDYGNPYNDIGAYLIQMQKYEEAIAWLERACVAPRYDARHYPYYNLGKVHERLGDYFEAIRAYRKAAEMEPGHQDAANSAERLQAWMN